MNNYLTPGFAAAVPMNPFTLAELAALVEQEEALHTGRVA